MAIKQVGIITAILLVVFTQVCAQHCSSIDNYIKYKSRKYYLLDWSGPEPLLPKTDLLQNVTSQDSALLQEITQKGRRSSDYGNFFLQKGVSIKAIKFDDFVDLPADTVPLTKRERRLKMKYDRLWKLENDLTIAGKSCTSVDKQLTKKKYKELHEKLLVENPYLFIMYPIYTYKSYTLTMFEIVSCRRCEAVFGYDICVFGSNSGN